ncbi:MAG: DUF4139 domain-containing protein [Myxococcales bacterium]|nr:DUF4139 domain-containing protein [Myxococcales bacterium]
MKPRTPAAPLASAAPFAEACRTSSSGARPRSWLVAALLAAAATTTLGCGEPRTPYATTDKGLNLERVVLYRNGVGYFERRGDVSGDVLTLRVRKDQVNDLLKSLTIVDKEDGKAVSVSMPLDPTSWANAALATLQGGGGTGNLASVLDRLRGTEVVLDTTEGSRKGRIVMVEQTTDEPDPTTPSGKGLLPQQLGRDFKVTLLDRDELEVVRLSKVRSVTLQDLDLAMQFHRTLDAAAGEGMFQQVEVSVRLVGSRSHDLVVSYVVSAPMWKPTYRVVLPEDGKGQALLQGWAVVDNTSGEDWANINLSLTSGAPIAFRYDLHTPRDVDRADLTESGVIRQARAALGETSWEQGPPAPPPPPPVAAPSPGYYPGEPSAEAEGYAAADGDYGGGYGRAASGGAPAAAKAADRRRYGPSTPARDEPAEPQPAIDYESLRRSTQASARAAMVSGLTRFDLGDRVTVPDGASTMVAVINQAVDGEETFLYRPGGAGTGYESSPYRVVRFRNTTPFVLEPGPIAIYSGGSFVGEGLSETVSSNTSATIPFAVEPTILVTSAEQSGSDEMRLIKLVRGVLEVENFRRRETTWDVKAQTMDAGFTVLIRHSKAGWDFKLKDRPEGTEDLPDAYLIPIKVPAGKRDGSLKVVEQTPSRTTISIWDGRALPLLENLLVTGNLPADARKKLDPIVRLRQEIGRIDTQIDGLEQQRRALDQRAEETRRSLESIRKDAAANELRKKLSDRLEEFTREGDRVGRQTVELQSKRLEKKIELEDLVQNLEINVPEK